MASSKIEERKARDRLARRAQILAVARQIAGDEGWSSVTVRRISEEIAYSQPVLYAHFGSREGIIVAAAVEGFGELGLALEKARQQSRQSNSLEAVASAYLDFASTSSALYEAMFSFGLDVSFGESSSPQELRYAFEQLSSLFSDQGSKSEILTEIFWASLHGLAELTRTKRLPAKRHKERVKALVSRFTGGDDQKDRS